MAPIPPLIGSALIGAGSNLLGNLFGASSTKKTNNTNLKINQMNNEFNERMMQKQMDYNTMMWNQQNAYNDPSAQRARLENAGLNPYMMINGGNAGNAQSAGSTSAASAAGAAPQQAFHPNFQGIPDSILMARQGNLLQAQHEKQIIDNQTAARRNMEEIHKLIADTKHSEARAKLIGVQYNNAQELYDLQKQNEVARRDHTIEQTKLTEAQRIYTDLQREWYGRLISKDLSLKLANLEILGLERNLRAEELRRSVFNTIKAEFDARQIELDFDTAKQIQDDVIERYHWGTTYGPIKDVLGDIFNTADAAMNWKPTPKKKMTMTKRRVGGNHKGDYYEDTFELR